MLYMDQITLLKHLVIKEAFGSAKHSSVTITHHTVSKEYKLKVEYGMTYMVFDVMHNPFRLIKNNKIYSWHSYKMQNLPNIITNRVSLVDLILGVRI